jgi:plasmid stabilization system protein ParE
VAIVVLAHAQHDLLSLQDYMLDRWSEVEWLKAEDEIFEKLQLVETGFLTGPAVQELASVGIFEYRDVFTSHHKLVYRRVESDTILYAAAGHQQDFPTLLMKRLLRV